MKTVAKLNRNAYLVIVRTDRKEAFGLEEMTAELTELTESASRKPAGFSTANVQHPSPRFFIREGKLEEVKTKAKDMAATHLVFNIDLSPGQARNIEKYCGIKVLDRTGLILEIFALRAKTSEGKLQVELAQLNYILPRLGGLGQVMSRLGGGVGTRGPGEQELEWDRRKIRKRIERVKDELSKVRKHRQLLRQGRKRKNFLTVSLVGYTNAGKSTLLNAMTGADTLVRDKMFATLDPKTRLQSLNGRRDMLVTDTVGLLRDLPHTLVEAFHATLEELTDSDVLIHVLDVSHPLALEHKRVTDQVLEEVGVKDKPCLLALNKADRLDETAQKTALENWPEGILISARDRIGLQGLLAKLNALA